MGWKGKYMGGFLGMLMGGPIGGLIGATLGDAKEESERAAKQNRFRAIAAEEAQATVQHDSGGNCTADP